MFIRRTKTRGTDGGKIYFSYRLVRSERSGGQVRQRTLLNLGSDFAVAQEQWPVLCARVEQLIDRQAELVAASCPEEVEREAQRIAMQLVSRAPTVEAGGGDLQTVDVDTLSWFVHARWGWSKWGCRRWSRSAWRGCWRGWGSTVGNGRW